MPRTTPRIAHLRAAGVSFVVDLDSGPLPRVLHWGEELGELTDADARALVLTADGPVLNSAPDLPRRCTVWPTRADGWSGTPGHEGHLGGSGTAPRLRLAGADEAPGELTVRLADDAVGLTVTQRFRLAPSGVLSVDATLRRLPDAPAPGVPYDLASAVLQLPVPTRASEVLDFTGKWCREAAPQRHPLVHGSHVRQARRGRPGSDTPLLLTVGVPGFGFGHGEVWAVHVAWSGDQHWFAERLPEGAGVHGATLGGGELLAPGEVRLAPGESHTTPVCAFGWSRDGLDGLAERFHTLLRGRPRHPSAPRPLTLNTWEAVYFDHREDKLLALADAAAEVGVERLVLDDGWFRGRRHDRAGLGDWSVDETVWPDGLTPLAARVRALGMQFGLWVEPEMVNLDSDLARAHPDWLLTPAAGPGTSWRHQHVLNVAHPDAWAYLLDALDTLVATYRIDYLKWDHNRDVHEAVAQGPEGERPGTRAQVTAVYALMDELRRRHPGLEIESCASGGARVDLGILARTDRVWASDCNDPVERQAIQRWTGQLLPPELIGSHVGAPRSHTTGRVTDGSFRLVTALFAHAGIEDDLTLRDPEERAALRSWAALYKETRPLLHSGRVVRADLDDTATLLHGVVSRDRRAALYAWVRLASSAQGQSGRVPLPGLDPAGRYRVRVRTEAGLPVTRRVADPAWYQEAVEGWVDLPGAVLATLGLPMPTLAPQQALLLEVGPGGS
ncbi:alpha-galactosidase [Streptomyces sp. NPDC050560]|uniref:alpha-galactosidase n=1 Tax=Streptomyces sp. NPDC050560 TaxID=3365630 RepID=UPI00378B689A